MSDARRLATSIAGVVWAVATAIVLAQGPPGSPRGAATPAQSAKAEEGIPIPDPLVQKACGPCHTVDDKQQISRISFQRNTPEGWQDVIRRMVELNGLQIDPPTARAVVKYLSDHLGLAPEEARAAAFEVERRSIDFKYTASTDAESTCTKCHSMGRVISQRRTREEWNLLIAMHRGWYPLVDNQAFRRSGPPPRDPTPDGRPPDARHPVEKALDHLIRAFPLKTPEWAAWSATMRSPRLDGAWVVSGAETGSGPVYGRATIKSGGRGDEFVTDIFLINARTGRPARREGQGVVYTGFQWRGRSAEGGREESALREVMFIDRNWRTMDGRWFGGAYDELGIDVRLERPGPGPHVLGTDRRALRVGSRGQTLKIYGANLPATLRASDIDLGPGVTVSGVAGVTPDQVTLTVDVAAGAVPGARDLFVAGASRASGLAVYDSIDLLKVTPAWAMARVGGANFPRGYAQFEARAFDAGADLKPETPDDIDLGLVPATWTLEEFAVTYDDDDVKFVGTIDPQTGRFTPNLDGPNPARSGSRNNVGDVYVVATYTPEGADGRPGKALRARAHLLVSVPLYRRWEPPAGR
jgi:quinohemoprotein amine dehydrogenase